jgi:hypothetical protein
MLGRTHSSDGKGKKHLQNFVWENLLEDRGDGKKNIKTDLRKMDCGSARWMELARDRIQRNGYRISVGKPFAGV